MFKLVVDEVLVPGDSAPLVWIGAAYVGPDAARRRGLVRRRLPRHLARRALPAVAAPARVRPPASASRSTSLDRRRLGDVLTRLSGDVAAIESFVLSGVADALVARCCRIVFFVGALFFLALAPRAGLARRRAAVLPGRPPLLAA